MKWTHIPSWPLHSHTLTQLRDVSAFANIYQWAWTRKKSSLPNSGYSNQLQKFHPVSLPDKFSIFSSYSKDSIGSTNQTQSTSSQPTTLTHLWSIVCCLKEHLLQANFTRIIIVYAPDQHEVCQTYLLSRHLHKKASFRSQVQVAEMQHKLLILNMLT